MYWFPDDIPGAIKEAMSQCDPVLISDTEIEKLGVLPVDIKRWCHKNLKTFVWMEEQDVTDVSLQYDYIYAFYIVDERDRNWFVLRWKS